MFRSIQCNRRLMFGPPSIAFFDGASFRPSEKIHLTPFNFSQIIEERVASDWRIISQPRPPSNLSFLLVKNSKVYGRIRPPVCIPFPRKDFPAGGLTKEQLLGFVDADTMGTFFMCLIDRAVAVCFVNKDGSIVPDSTKTFSLLYDQHQHNLAQNRIDPRRDYPHHQRHQRGGDGGRRQQQRGGDNSNNNLSSSPALVDYDDPGFVRPGAESPMYAEFFDWFNRVTPRLERTSQWVVRRDEPDNIMWQHLKQIQRKMDKEERIATAVSESENQQQQQGIAGSSTFSAVALEDTYFEDATDLGGHEPGTAAASAYQSAKALQRRSMLDNPQWIVVPPNMMRDREVMVGGTNANKVNLVGAVGRMRHGFLEFV